MFRNYLLIAFRQIRKQKMYAAIKIGGFALGIAVCLLMALYIRHETSYDRFWKNQQDMYRVVGVFNDEGNILKGTGMPPPMAAAIKKDFPEIVQSARLLNNPLFRGAGTNYVRLEGKTEQLYESNFAYVDPQWLDMMQIPMVYGSREQALANPLTVVIAKSKAEKYYPGENPVGKVIYLNDNNNEPYTIAGVMEDIPENSYLPYQFLLTLTGKELWPGEQPSWGSSNYENYLIIQHGTDIKDLAKRLTSLVLNKYMIPARFNDNAEGAAQLLASASLVLQPLHEVYLESNGINDAYRHGDIRIVWLFAAIACFILVIASINFINLSTARSANRAREVGLRKVVGSGRGGLIRQFLVESIVYSLLSFSVALILAALLLPLFNNMMDKSLVMPWSDWWLFPVVTLAMLVIGLLAGMYPSFYLSAFKPVQVLKGRISLGAKSSFLRNGLVVFQFTTSVILIIGTIIIYSQLNFILNRKMGFDKNQVVLVQGADVLGDRLPQFRQEVKNMSQVSNVTVSGFLPVGGSKRNGNTFWKAGEKEEESGVPGQIWEVDDQYLNTMGMSLAAGRNFSPQLPTDSQAILINQTMAHRLRLDNPVGKRITNGNSVWQVIGLVEDFNFSTLEQPVGPLCFRLGNSPSVISIKMHTADMKATIASLESTWKKVLPGQPFRYAFLDEQYAAMYDNVTRTGKMVSALTILAVIIACLGLFALSAYMAEQRSREIGIRKALGAGIANITQLLSWDYLKLVLLSIVIASPVAWWMMHAWLQDFVYRIKISPWFFVVAGTAALLVALLTVSFQSIKAALVKPVDSLRSE